MVERVGLRSVKGFTIVELLIVVVVIAILAAVTIVAYSGIQNRAKDSALKSNVEQASRKVAAYAVTNNETVPADLPAFFAATGLSAVSGSTYEYLVSPDFKNYCISVYSTAGSYASSSSSGSVSPGRCVRNYALNPSLETSVTTNIGLMGGANTDATRVPSSAWALSGTQSTIVTKITSTGNPKGVRVGTTPVLADGDVVNWSATVRNNAASAKQFQLYGERSSPSYAGLTGSACQSVNAGAVQTITGGTTITASNSGQVGFGVLPCGANTAVGESYNLDGFVVTINQPLPTGYVDGTTPGWAWDGIEHGSSSFGPTPVQ